MNLEVFPADKRPNHALVNQYGRFDGIMRHTDGPAYFPTVAIISLGSPCIFDFESPGGLEQSVLLPARSLLVFEGEAYKGRHGIDPSSSGAREVHRPAGEFRDVGGPRTSLTIRHVPAGPPAQSGELGPEGAQPAVTCAQPAEPAQQLST